MITINAGPDSKIPGTLGTAAKPWIWDDTHEALYIPELRLAPGVVRAVVQSQTLYVLLQDVRVRERNDAEFEPGEYGYAWGDLQVFVGGEPTVLDALFLRPKYLGDFNRIFHTLQALRKKRDAPAL